MKGGIAAAVGERGSGSCNEGEGGEAPTTDGRGWSDRPTDRRTDTTRYFKLRYETFWQASERLFPRSNILAAISAAAADTLPSARRHEAAGQEDLIAAPLTNTTLEIVAIVAVLPVFLTSRFFARCVSAKGF